MKSLGEVTCAMTRKGDFLYGEDESERRYTVDNTSPRGKLSEEWETARASTEQHFDAFFADEENDYRRRGVTWLNSFPEAVFEFRNLTLDDFANWARGRKESGGKVRMWEWLDEQLNRDTRLSELIRNSGDGTVVTRPSLLGMYTVDFPEGLGPSQRNVRAFILGAKGACHG